MRKTKEQIAEYKKRFYSIPENRERKRLTDKKWRELNIDKARETARKYYQTVKDKFKLKEKRRIIKLRIEVMSAYGNKCVCCGETELIFLTIDHINNDGAEHRRQLYGSQRGHGVGQFYRWLKKHGFPKENFQILCANCNFGKYRNGGICPHKTKVTKFTTNIEII